ncbi:hypothetical protein [Phyllobacterium leguminum]|uniref:Lipoprotein n=1 Tax=Phyllobacterium leguminum TaxID=314237 RepID=A0A318SY77_9HYPH|nr:hypothetical protein [Phyllobacterium leguminum]PYE86881.1 hypothetical protein C7477_11819 [Phyllobacterium leguminum]
MTLRAVLLHSSCLAIVLVALAHCGGGMAACMDRYSFDTCHHTLNR